MSDKLIINLVLKGSEVEMFNKVKESQGVRANAECLRLLIKEAAE